MTRCKRVCIIYIVFERVVRCIFLKVTIPADAPRHAWQSLPRTPEPSFVTPVDRLNLELSPDETDRSSTAAETVVSKKKEELISEW